MAKSKTKSMRVSIADYKFLVERKRETGIPLREIMHTALTEYFNRLSAEKLITDQIAEGAQGELITMLRKLLSIR